MRNILLLALALGLGACASKPHQKLLVDHDSPIFQSESLWRIASHDSKEGSYLKTCYQGDLKGFTQSARNEYAKGAKTVGYWIWVGNCLAWHDELREARFFLGLAQDLAKTKEENAAVKNNLAVIYLRQGRVSRAFDLLNESRVLAPQFNTPSFNLAQIYISQNMNQEGLKVLSVPPFEKSMDPEVLNLKGLAYIQSGNAKVAGEYLSKIPSKFHSREDIALTLAQWHLLEARPNQAKEILENYKTTGLTIPYKLAERLKREASQQLAALEAKSK
ncbi:MAG: hypothetical protein K2P81_17860 [Bacteriovoracaceae bacterium]|nr:hypothetical protein [Bacteriovoracaceae bacterium]